VKGLIIRGKAEVMTGQSPDHSDSRNGGKMLQRKGRGGNTGLHQGEAETKVSREKYKEGGGRPVRCGQEKQIKKRDVTSLPGERNRGKEGQVWKAGMAPAQRSVEESRGTPRRKRKNTPKGGE